MNGSTGTVLADLDSNIYLSKWEHHGEEVSFNLGQNVKKDARCMSNFRILWSKARFTQDTSPFPSKNKVEVLPEHFCSQLNDIDQGGVGEGSPWYQIRGRGGGGCLL